MRHDMNNQLLIPDDKIYIYPSDWKQPVRIQFENGSSIESADYKSYRGNRVDMWPDYNWPGIDEELRSFIEDYVSKNFPKEEYSVSIHNECYCESLL